jgi:hypothetical protein
MARKHKQLTTHYFENWKIIVAKEKGHYKGTRYYQATCHWYAFPTESTTDEFNSATHQGSGGIEKAEIKLTALYLPETA